MATIFVFWVGGLNAQNTVYSPLFTAGTFNKIIDVSKPVGVVKGNPQVTGSGGASYTIPIEVPPGTNGVKPSLSVSYNSQGGNGVLGYGWSIDGLSSITRGLKSWYNDGKVETTNNSASDAFYIDGSRLILISGTYGTLGSTYKTENENYSSIEITNNCGNGPWVFDVTTKDGIVMEKEDAGYYRYTGLPHTQSSIAHLASTTLPPPNISSNTQQIKYAPFQRVENITENGFEQQFTYEPGYNRAKSVLLQNTNLIETRYYFSNYELQINTNTGADNKIHYINAGNGLCAIIVIDNTNTATTYYVYKDHLGSINTITDDVGSIIAQQSFDAWGRNRNATNWTYNAISPNPEWLYRGFTGHEHMPEFGLINMNARLYDPVVGKMISPDNYVSNNYSSQAYNRYSYANNNPLVFYDPDGNIAWFVPIIIGAIIGGALNLHVQAQRGNVNNFWQGLGYFATGAVAGAVSGAGLSFGLAALGGGFITGMGFATAHLSVQIAGIALLSLKAFGTITTITSIISDGENAWDIIRGRYYLDESRTFGGQLIQGVSRFSWEAFQTELGYGYTHLRNTVGNVSRVDYFRGATFSTNENSSNWQGISLGNFINIAIPNEITGTFEDRVRSDQLYMHEYGHTFDSRRFGVFYLFLIGIPSAAGACWTEARANRHAERYFRTQFGYIWNELEDPLTCP